ncbi:cholecystokinin receptor-like [Argopecten irradians]|uniref:cholecystokinin receptor-like n=1 Tax=Argopecten irradians TaxID=31199 RepID=UPI003719DD44
MLNTTDGVSNYTTLPTSMTVWELPIFAVIISVIYLALDVVFGLFTNTLLIMIIYNSPSLRTPPNSHLVNISINNILLCVCILFSLITVSAKPGDLDNSRVLTGIQLFLTSVCAMQYLCTFASIGFYRNRTMQKPSLSLKVRRTIVSRSILISILITYLLGLVFTLAFLRDDDDVSLSLNPLQRRFAIKAIPPKDHLTADQFCALGFISIVYTIGLIVIFRCYYNICRTLNITGTIGRNRVLPLNRNFSLSSDATGDLNLHSRTAYAPEDNNSFARPYSIPSEDLDSSVIVHYKRNENLLAFEDIFALENPILASSLKTKLNQKIPLGATLSNSSTTSTKSRHLNFADISPGADLQRLQTIKNNSALKKQSLRRDRISLSSATKNSIIMLSAYISCTFPLLLCSIPGILDKIGTNRIFVLLSFRLLFYLNVCIYPLWYLLFSKRVRKCMFRLFENVLLCLKVRR